MPDATPALALQIHIHNHMPKEIFSCRKRKKKTTDPKDSSDESIFKRSKNGQFIKITRRFHRSSSSSPDNSSSDDNSDVSPASASKSAGKSLEMPYTTVKKPSLVSRPLNGVSDIIHVFNPQAWDDWPDGDMEFDLTEAEYIATVEVSETINWPTTGSMANDSFVNVWDISAVSMKLVSIPSIMLFTTRRLGDYNSLNHVLYASQSFSCTLVQQEQQSIHGKAADIINTEVITIMTTCRTVFISLHLRKQNWRRSLLAMLVPELSPWSLALLVAIRKEQEKVQKKMNISASDDFTVDFAAFKEEYESVIKQKSMGRIGMISLQSPFMAKLPLMDYTPVWG
ncbi:hypothetical protein C8J56DRAFT_888817 [Mycena floridula]|nr:hypothetical protein C8J56DRAFT_888817 [Mycena floridula]